MTVGTAQETPVKRAASTCGQAATQTIDVGVTRFAYEFLEA